MDEADSTQERQEAEAAIRARIRENRASKKPADGPENCQGCGDVMHPIRRGHGFDKCVDCQAALEKHGKNFRRISDDDDE